MDTFNLIRNGLAIKGLLSIVKNNQPNNNTKSVVKKQVRQKDIAASKSAPSKAEVYDKSTDYQKLRMLDDQIKKLQDTRNQLTQRLFEGEKDIRKRFVMWAENGQDKRQLTYLPDGHLRQYCDRRGIIQDSRGVINLMDYDDSFGLFSLNDKELVEYDCFDEAEALKGDMLFVAACEQMMRENINSFAIDW
jgi:hypothetical protein